MSNKKSHSRKNTKSTNILSAFVLALFLGFVGFTIFAIGNISSVVEEKIVSSINNIPSSWAELEEESTIQNNISYRVVDGTKVQYLVSVQNNGDMPVEITHLSSYMEDGDKKGFMSLVNGLLEYTYTKDNSISWTKVEVSEPGNKSDSFKLSNMVYLGKKGDATDNAYFRFMVDLTEDALVSEKVSFIVEKVDGTQKLSSSSTNIAFHKPDETRMAAEKIAFEDPSSALQDPTDESGEYTKPLGVISESTSDKSTSADLLGIISISPDSFNVSMIIATSLLGAFALSLIIYLVVRAKRNSSR